MAKGLQGQASRLAQKLTYSQAGTLSHANARQCREGVGALTRRACRGFVSISVVATDPKVSYGRGCTPRTTRSNTGRKRGRLAALNSRSTWRFTRSVAGVRPGDARLLSDPDISLFLKTAGQLMDSTLERRTRQLLLSVGSPLPRVHPVHARRYSSHRGLSHGPAIAPCAPARSPR